MVLNLQYIRRMIRFTDISSQKIKEKVELGDGSLRILNPYFNFIS